MGEDYSPQNPLRCPYPRVSLLGNPGKQDGDLRGRSPEKENYLSPGRRERFKRWSPVGTGSPRKRTLVFISHGAETDGFLQNLLLLLPAPADHSPLSGVGPRARGIRERGRGRGRGANGFRGVLRVRAAEFGGVPSPHPSPPLSFLQPWDPAASAAAPHAPLVSPDHFEASPIFFPFQLPGFLTHPLLKYYQVSPLVSLAHLVS